MKGLLAAEDAVEKRGAELARASHRIISELATFEYSNGYYDYLYNRHEREMGR